LTDRDDRCNVLDSVYAHSGLERPISLTGKATVDANQYHVRGVVRLETKTSGDIFFEFASSMLFGSRVEDFFCSIVEDTLRIVDRERGQIFVGQAAEEFLVESLAMDFGVRESLALVLGGHPRCGEIDELKIDSRPGGAVVSGRTLGEPFRVEFSEDGSLNQVQWPIPDDPNMGDRLRVEYDWEPTSDGPMGLRQMIIYLEGREWRCKLVSTTG
jgi:hypothetical protein